MITLLDRSIEGVHVDMDDFPQGSLHCRPPLSVLRVPPG